MNVHFGDIHARCPDALLPLEGFELLLELQALRGDNEVLEVLLGVKRGWQGPPGREPSPKDRGIFVYP